MMWLQHPRWIIHSVWGPFHFYLTGAVLAIWNNPIYAPVILNIVLSILMLFPFYFFVKREFNPDGAFAAVCLLAVSPVIFRNSMMNMSETPYLFLLVLTLNFISRGMRRNAVSDFILAGIFASLGSAIRYEFWLFIAIFAFFAYLKSGIRFAIMFLSTGLIYPVMALASDFLLDNHAIKGFFASYPWSLHIQLATGFQDYLRRIWFYPLCLLVSLGPFAFIAVKELVWQMKGTFPASWCAQIFFIFLLITIGNAFFGTILLHERFVSTIALLAIPFISGWFKDISKVRIRLAAVFIISTVALSYVYNLSNITPLPRLSDQTGEKVSEIVNRSLGPGGGLVVDFWDWENTYYVALETKLGLNDLFVQEGDALDTLRENAIDSIIVRHKHGVILLVRNSKLWHNTEIKDNTLRFKFSSQILNTRTIFNNNEIKVWSYTDYH